MAPTLSELAQRWRQNPTAVATIALCEALRASPAGQASPLVEQVGQAGSRQYAKDAAVLLAIGKMYADADRLADAQAVLVNAGKLAPRDADVYRTLGEVLLRRGDADRAEKVLARAIQLGAPGAEVQPWVERARALKPMQSTAGPQAVAAEVAHALAGPPRGPVDSDTDTAIRILPASVPSNAPPPARVPPRFSRDAQTAPVSFETPSPVPPAGDARAGALARAGDAPLPPRPAVLRESPGVLDVPIPTAPPLPKGLGIAPAELRANAGPSNGHAVAAPAAASVRTMVPHPRDVLDAFSLAGVFEPPASVSVSAGWDRGAKRPKRKGTATIITGMVVFLAGSAGVYSFYRHKRAQEHVAAEAVLADAEGLIRAGKIDSLGDVENKLARAFQLDTRSPRAALDWARERALVCILKSGADVGFEDAMGRAKDLGISEDKYAFAKVDSFLYQGDTAGAAGVMAKWDGPAGADAWYQLAAGATLERAGDPRARDRYAAAVKLDPDLFVAQVAQARATAIEGDPQEAMRTAKAMRIAHPDRAEPVALVALAWGRDPRREDAVPPEVEDVVKREADLPASLRFVPHAVLALRDLGKHDDEGARSEVERGLARADSPGAAVWLGTIALPLGDAALARRAALAALQLSAAYAPARALAARVALLGGRLDEALKATEELDPTSPDVAVVRAAVAYERVDPDGAARAMEPLPAQARQLPFLVPLARASDAIAGKVALEGNKLVAMGGDDAPWSDLVAMDVALDSGDVASSDAIAASWGKDASQSPLRALRLARLARYEGRLEDADALSLTALDHGTVTPRVLFERVFVLTAKGRSSEVGPLLSRYPLVLGPLANWLSAFAAASGGNVEAAKGKTASADPPPPTAPLAARVVAAAAFGAMKDKRRGVDYVRDVLASGSLHPDLVTAALALGFHKVDHGRRKPTYAQ